MTRSLHFAVATLGLAAVGWSCGSSPPPSAESPPVDASAATAAPIGDADAGAAGAPAAEPAGADANVATAPPTTPEEVKSSGETNAPAKEPEAKFFPIDVLTGREMAYLVDYAASGVIEAAKKGCAGKPEEDPSKFDECLAKARDKFGADVLRFRKDDQGKIKLTMYRRNSSSLVETYNANVELKEASAHVVKVVLKGGGAGQRPIMKARRDFEIKVPNGYSLELDDPSLGKLPYDAKVGLVAN